MKNYLKFTIFALVILLLQTAALAEDKENKENLSIEEFKKKIEDNFEARLSRCEEDGYTNIKNGKKTERKIHGRVNGKCMYTQATEGEDTWLCLYEEKDIKNTSDKEVSERSCRKANQSEITKMSPALKKDKQRQEKYRQEAESLNRLVAECKASELNTMHPMVTEFKVKHTITPSQKSGFCIYTQTMPGNKLTECEFDIRDKKAVDLSDPRFMQKYCKLKVQEK